MVKCESCNFFVDSSMKFVLMQNVCPSCGNNLFSDKERADLKLIQKRLSQNEFASTFSESQTYEIALFVINEIKNGLGQIYLQNTLAEMASGMKPIEVKFDESELERIRREVEDEKFGAKTTPNKAVVMGNKVDASLYASVLEDEAMIDEETYASAFSNTSDFRTERLKRLAKQHNTSNKSIRRMDE